MKNIKIFLIGIIIIIVIGGYIGFKNGNISNRINLGIVYNEDINEALDKNANEYLKAKAVEAIEKYYGIKMDYNDISFRFNYNTVVEQTELQKSIVEDVKKQGFVNLLKKAEEDLARKKIGTIDIFIDDNSKNKYFVSFGDIEKQLITIKALEPSNLNEVELINMIDIEPSKEIAKKFIIDHNIFEYNNLNFVGLKELVTYYEREKPIFDTYILYYEDKFNINRGVNITIDRVTKKIIEITFDEKAKLDYEMEGGTLASELENKILKIEAMNLIQEYFQEYFNVKVDSNEINKNLQYISFWSEWIAYMHDEKYFIQMDKKGNIMLILCDTKNIENYEESELDKQQATNFILNNKLLSNDNFEFIKYENGTYVFSYEENKNLEYQRLINIYIIEHQVVGFGFDR